MLRLFNTLTKKVERFAPLKDKKVGMYTCGPTVYDFASIGNFRTYTTADLLLRTLKANDYRVDYIMNFTDVGHLTGDNLGDSSIGEDRMEKAARREGKNTWEIAQFYIDAFLKDFHTLNLEEPARFVRATDHIKEQINLIKTLEEKGFTYKTSDGIYFDTQKFEEKTDKKYGELSTLDQIKEGARVEINAEKKNPRDFALWKFSPKDVSRQMEWDSPWGVGFPGWHIECSAMSMKYLGETVDIHTGGEDLRSTHHPNEIAQSEAATGKQFVRFWVHGAFLLVDGGRMGKSLGNFYTISDILERGFDPLALRYLYLTGHYREQLNFTWESLKAAQNTLNKLRQEVRNWEKPESDVGRYWQKFLEADGNDLNTPQALAVLHEMVSSNITTAQKARDLLEMDKILGLGLEEYVGKQLKIPEEVQRLVDKREQARKSGDFEKSDSLRKDIQNKGFELEDTPSGPKLRR